MAGELVETPLILGLRNHLVTHRIAYAHDAQRLLKPVVLGGFRLSLL
jgi:hypothetical protein